MLQFTTAEITAWIGTWLWPLFRIGAALGAIPMIGTRLVPARVRLGFALILTLVIAPMAPAPPAVNPLSPAGVLITAQQILIGASMGFSVHMLFQIYIHAGQMIAMQMGLGFASMVDPANGVQVPVISQFYAVLITLIWLALDGHLILIRTLAGSFLTLPVSATGLGGADLWQLSEWAGRMFMGAMQVSLPMVTALLVVNLGFGVMSRAAPQLNIFAVGFPISVLFGFALMLLGIETLGGHFTRMFAETRGLLTVLLGG